MQRKELFRDLVILFFCLTILLLPFSIRLSNLCLVGGSISWFFYGIFNKKIKFKNPVLFLIVVVWFGIHVISLFYSSDINAGLFSLEKRLPLLLMPLLFATFPFNKKTVHLLLKIFIFSLFISTLVCYFYAFIFRFQIRDLSHLTRVDWAYFSYSLTEILRFHHVYYALYTVWTIAILLYWLFYFNYTNKLKKCGIILLTIYFAIFTAVLSSRTALIALIIILIFFIILFVTRTKKYLVSTIIIISLIFISIVSFKYIPYLSYKFDDIFAHGISNNPRGVIFPLSIEVIKENLLFGVGIGDVSDELMKQYSKYEYKEGLSFGYNAHNQYLHTLLWGGLLGLLILIIHILSTFIHAYKEKQVLYLIFLFLFWFCCISEVMLATQKGVMFYAFFSSMFLFTTYGKHRNGGKDKSEYGDGTKGRK